METITLTTVIKTNEETTTISVEIPYTGDVKDLESFITNSQFMWYKLGFTDNQVESAFEKVNIM